MPQVITRQNDNGMLMTYVNHIAFALDASGSMNKLEKSVVGVFDKVIDSLKITSLDSNQETRVSIYLFGVVPTPNNNNTGVKCLVSDMDVMRMPSIKDYYKAQHMTPLRDGAMQAISDLEKIYAGYGDHAFILYVLTDGQENASTSTAKQLKAKIDGLPDNWTTICMVPDKYGQEAAVNCGFSRQNIEVWETTQKGIEEAGEKFTQAFKTYTMVRASTGLSGANSGKARKFYQTFNADAVKVEDVTSQLTELVEGKDYKTLLVRDAPKEKNVIKAFVESWTGEQYRTGSTYYELMKKETIQDYKKIILQNKDNGRTYGGDKVRNILGLASTGNILLDPKNNSKWRIFVQSTAPNRNLIPNTLALLRL